MHHRARVAVIALIGLAVLSACSGGATADPSAIKGSFDIGGRALYLECTGNGAPTIVMDSGLGNTHTTWAKVVPELRGSNRTCTYDRANIGASDKAPTPRTSADVVADLHLLLEVAGVNPPYVLVGHSFGGLSVRLFASTHPGDVVAVVLVDAPPITFVDDECAIVDAGLCEKLRVGWQPSKNPEGLDLAGSGSEITAADPLPAVPLVVLAATNHHQSAITDAGFEKGIEAIWQRRQEELAASVLGGRVQVVPGGHDIQLEHPEAVVAAIRSVLAGLPNAT